MKPELDSKPVEQSATGRRRDITAEERAELRTADAMRELLASRGWKVYSTVLQAHLQSKRNEFEQPAETRADGIAQVLRSESAKGAIMGLRLALSIPDGILANDKILRGQLGLSSEEEP